jgi:Glucodextranase, domain B
VNNLSRLLGISLLIFLLALPIAACKPWEAGYILNVTVDTPQDKTTVSASPVTVSGTVTKTAEVKINDVVVPIKGGKFSTDLKLTEGSNVINVVATSGKDTVTKTVTITYNPSKQ